VSLTTLSYVDTSTAMKLLVEEMESPALVAELTGNPRLLVDEFLWHMFGGKLLAFG